MSDAPRIIVITGPRGSGKTTLALQMSTSLRAEGKSVWVCWQGSPAFRPPPRRHVPFDVIIYDGLRDGEEVHAPFQLIQLSTVKLPETVTVPKDEYEKLRAEADRAQLPKGFVTLTQDEYARLRRLERIEEQRRRFRERASSGGSYVTASLVERDLDYRLSRLESLMRQRTYDSASWTGRV